MSNISSQCSMTSLNMRTFRTSNPRKEKAINNRDRIIREGIKKEAVVIKVNIEGEVKAEVRAETKVRAEARANDIVETEDVLNTSRSSSRHLCSATTTQPPLTTRPATESVRCTATSFTALTSLGRIT